MGASPCLQFRLRCGEMKLEQWARCREYPPRCAMFLLVLRVLFKPLFQGAHCVWAPVPHVSPALARRATVGGNAGRGSGESHGPETWR